MKILITGKSGQLAQAFIRKFQADGTEFIAPEESSCDITSRQKVNEIVDACKPGVILNCAAYNFVDTAEQESSAAHRVNAEGPGILAEAAKRHSAIFVHFSSDYVFNGAKEDGLYYEEDSPDPLNEYGKSKLAGEKLVHAVTDKYLIFRLSWVFGDGRQNFIYKLLEWSRKNEYLKIACDEFSVPTYTHMIADVVMKAVDSGAGGLFHLTSSGFCSRFEWAREVIKTLGSNTFIRPVSMDMFKLPAKRPHFSAMSNKKIAELLKVEIPGWEEGVRRFFHERSGTI